MEWSLEDNFQIISVHTPKLFCDLSLELPQRKDTSNQAHSIVGWSQHSIMFYGRDTSAKGFFASQGRVKELCDQLEKFGKELKGQEI